MANHVHKDEYALAYDADKKRLRLEARIIMDSMLNGALTELARIHNDAEARGEVVQAIYGEKEVRGLLLNA